MWFQDRYAWCLASVVSGFVAVVDRLLAIPDLVVNKADDKVRSPLYVACRYGHLDAVERLLRDPRIDGNRPNVRPFDHVTLPIEVS